MEYWLDSLFIQIWNMSITAGYCIAAVLIIRLLLWRIPRKYLYVLWLVVAFRLICPVSVSTVFSLFNLEHFSEGRSADNVEYIQYIPEHTGNMEGEGIRTERQPSDGRPSAMLPAAKYVWIFGILVFMVYYTVSMRHLKRKVRMAVRADISAWEDVCRGGVFECDGLASPFAMGILCPRIYLPCGLKEEERRLILLHEQYHIRRKDYLVKPFSFFLLAVYWFHPLVWAAWFCMCKDMEMSCDERVLELLGEGHGKEYGLTLLAFASGSREGRMPLGFGENDVKSRIQHVLKFKRPAVYVAVLSVIVIGAALALLGTNEVKDETKEEAVENYSEAAQKLYEARNSYVGDASANGRLISAIAEAMPDSCAASMEVKTELWTLTEPYEFHFVIEDELEKEPDFYSMAAPAVLMLALTDNLGVVQWEYTIGSGKASVLEVRKWSADDAARWCGVNEIKEYSGSPEKVQELLDILKERQSHGGVEESMEEEISGQSAELPPDEELFMNWYSRLPADIYKQAVPYEEWMGHYDDKEKDYMVILAQTEDNVVTVYGCTGEQYGARGITVDYRITPDGDSSHNYFDWGWNPMHADPEVFMYDYDRDGRDEIAFRMAGMTGTGVYVDQLIIFETYSTGTVVPYEFTPYMQQEGIDELLDVTIDRENRLVQIIDKSTPESSVPFVSIPYEESYGGEALDVEFLGQVRFRIGEKLFMETEPGVVMEDYAAPLYAFGDEDVWNERLITFRIVYDYSGSLESGYFTLLEPVLQKGGR